ncbi:hypothetical protein Sste5346_007889 [Sporothrix stenoceras]|uniref:Amidase domain-containing protein n=1 Tax=Sporothrix stenoceras TaxID=5173 RepID=A0ABR3YUQ2_9PEZI
MPVTQEDVLRVAREVGFDVPTSELAAYTELLQKAEAAFETVAALDDYQPTPDLDAAPRKDVHRPSPEQNPLNAWAWRCNCEHASPSTTLLKGKSVCFKDNIAMAGMPCLVGTDSFSDWTPSMDATVVTRVLENGGMVAGKAVCENLSRGAVSCTSATGPVHNPYARGYNAGGSSSGTAALVGSGAVDMGLGCDQGGSIRIPAAMCGLYGFKATTGLVPYTGIASNDASVDYVGPITTTCTDCATLLQAVAGVDNLDDRQGPGTPFPSDVPAYKDLLKYPSPGDLPLSGLRIGVLLEGTNAPNMDPSLLVSFQQAVEGFKKLGAMVVDVSVPLHTRGRTIYSVLSKMGNHMGMRGQATGRRQVILTDLFEKKGKTNPYDPKSVAAMGVVSKEGLLAGALGWEQYPLAYYKAVNLMRQLSDKYDEVFETVDLIVMPTTLKPSTPLPGTTVADVAAVSPLAQIAAAGGLMENTSPFNGTGHPALAIPIGFVPATDDPTIQLPASLQIVGKFFDEARILQVAYAWETAYDWKTIKV